MLNQVPVLNHIQLPLIQIVNKDDELLSNNHDAQWYSILKNFPWEDYRELAVSYYNALYDFNISKQLASFCGLLLPCGFSRSLFQSGRRSNPNPRGQWLDLS